MITKPTTATKARATYPIRLPNFTVIAGTSEATPIVPTVWARYSQVKLLALPSTSRA